MSAVIATAILCLTLGSSLSWTRSSNSTQSDVSDEEIGELEKLATQEECKMVLIVRNDLGMGKGKIAAQCSHAAVKNFQSIQRSHPFVLQQWEIGGQPKIVLECRSEQEMLELQSSALERNLCAHIIKDAGRTQIAAGSRTVLAIGPGPKSAVDQVSGHLKLL